MAAVLVPAYGEAFTPYSLKVKKISIGSASDNDVVLSSTGVYKVFTPSHGVFVENMIVNKVTAFNISTINVGDTDEDGFLAGTDTIFSDAGIKNMKDILSSAFGANVAAYKHGRLYSSDNSDTMAINVTVNTAAVSAGKAYLYILYFDTAIV